MVVNLRGVLMILAIVCFVLNACGISTWKGEKTNLSAAGLAFWALAVLIG